MSVFRKVVRAIRPKDPAAKEQDLKEPATKTTEPGTKLGVDPALAPDGAADAQDDLDSKAELRDEIAMLRNQLTDADGFPVEIDGHVYTSKEELEDAVHDLEEQLAASDDVAQSTGSEPTQSPTASQEQDPGSLKPQSQSGIRLELDETSQRESDGSSFASVVKETLSESDGLAGGGQEEFAPFTPGGAVVSSALDDTGVIDDLAGAAGNGGDSSQPTSEIAGRDPLSREDIEVEAHAVFGEIDSAADTDLQDQKDTIDLISNVSKEVHDKSAEVLKKLSAEPPGIEDKESTKAAMFPQHQKDGGTVPGPVDVTRTPGDGLGAPIPQPYPEIQSDSMPTTKTDPATTTKVEQTDTTDAELSARVDEAVVDAPQIDMGDQVEQSGVDLHAPNLVVDRLEPDPGMPDLLRGEGLGLLDGGPGDEIGPPETDLGMLGGGPEGILEGRGRPTADDLLADLPGPEGPDRSTVGVGGDPRVGGDWSGTQRWTDTTDSDGNQTITGTERYDDGESITTVTTTHEGGVTTQTVTSTNKTTGETTTETSTQGGSDDSSGSESSGGDTSGDASGDGGEPSDGTTVGSDVEPAATPLPDDSGPGTYGGETPPGPPEDPIDHTIDAETMMQPVGEEGTMIDDRPPPLTFEDAMKGSVDPYAQYTDDHVDIGTTIPGTVDPDNTLIDPPDILDDHMDEFRLGDTVDFDDPPDDLDD